MIVSLLSYTAMISSNCPRVLRDVAVLYPSAKVAGPRARRRAATSFTVEKQSHDGRVSYCLCHDSAEVGVFPSPSVALANLEYLVNSSAMMGLAHHLLIHSGAVSAPTGGIMIPGPSGAGKSTLVAALCLEGFGCFSDELAVLELESGDLLPFSRSICLKDGGWEALRASYPSAASALDSSRNGTGPVHYLGAPAIPPTAGRTAVRYILLPRRIPGVLARLLPVTRPAALMDLARQSLNLPRHGGAGLELLARLVEGSVCYALTYEDLPSAVSLVAELVGGEHR